MAVVSVHKPSSTSRVTTLMTRLEPSPGILKALVFKGAAALWGSAMGRLPVVDDGQDFFAHADEFGFGLDAAGIAMAQKSA